ncbi:hypothetical protein PybrP1_012979 [[Pythium] brassicae (nom. inval.)]|nr:hypothetical protein PybrP1_012979 [[Pythium] brassicae (nom. inval.)]
MDVLSERVLRVACCVLRVCVCVSGQLHFVDRSQSASQPASESRCASPCVEQSQTEVEHRGRARAFRAEVRHETLAERVVQQRHEIVWLPSLKWISESKMGEHTLARSRAASMGDTSSRKRRRARSRSRSKSAERSRHHSSRRRSRRSRSDSRSRSRERDSRRKERRRRSRSRSHSRSHSRSASRSRKERKERKEREKRRRARSDSRERTKREETAAAASEGASGGVVAPTTAAADPHVETRDRSDAQAPVGVAAPAPAPVPVSPPSAAAPVDTSAATVAVAVAVADATAARGSTAEAAKPFKFGGIALKADHKLKPNADEKTSRRQEKLRLWREQQLRLKQAEAQRFLAAEEDAAPKPLTLWRAADDDDDIDDNDNDNDNSRDDSETPEQRRKREAQEAQQRQREQQVVEEVDPLDAYMAGLVDEAAIQQSIANPAANVISLDEIEAKAKVNIYGTFLPQFSADVGTPADDDDSGGDRDADREEREERELQEFMRALKEQRAKEAAGGGDGGGGGNGDDVDGDDAAGKRGDTGRIYQGVEEDAIGEGAAHIDTRSALEILQEAQKKKEIKAVDHSQARGARLTLVMVVSLLRCVHRPGRVHSVPEKVLRGAEGDQGAVGGRGRGDPRAGRDQDPGQELPAADPQVDAVRL